MAVYKIFPEKDASIYTEYPDMNTGLDSILDCSTYLKNDSSQVCRSLIQFSTNDIDNVINNLITTSSFNVFLRGYNALLKGLNQESQLFFHPISSSWDMGTGHFQDSPENLTGVSWNYNTSFSGSRWASSSFDSYTTASFQPSLPGGGNWYISSSLGLNLNISQSFSYSNAKDINVDVTNIVLNWHSGSIDNNGIIIKQQDSNEFVYDKANSTTFKFFSIDTHTIYPPALEFKWDDFSSITGSNNILNTLDAFISVNNNSGRYFLDSIETFRISTTPKYPPRVFQTSSLYTKDYYLPLSSSYYAIKDSETNEFIIDFDEDYTKISSDEEGSYFNIYMKGLEPERYYTILIKVHLNGNVKIFDDGLMFKVING